MIASFFTGSQGMFTISTAQAADNPVAAQLDLARQALSNAAPIIQDNLPNVGYQTDTQGKDVVTPPDGFLAKPLVTETIVRQDPKPVIKRAVASTVKTVRTTAVASYSSGAVGNHFPYGYCTYYVANRRSVPWFGNAITWLSGARLYGFATGSVPQAGAIMVTSEGGSAGHVAYVESVDGDQITVSEMNYRGFGVISSRTISAGYPYIKGYIY